MAEFMPSRRDEAKLSDDERVVMDLLFLAWIAWERLPDMDSVDDQLMEQAIQTAQNVVGVRVARRMDPEQFAARPELPAEGAT